MKNSIKMIGISVASFILGGATLVCANQAIQAIQNTNIKISLNGEVQEFKDETTGEMQYPITYNDRTYLPLRNVAYLSGLNVDYDQTSNTAILNSNNSLINEIITKAEQQIKYPVHSDNSKTQEAIKTTVNSIKVFDEDYIRRIANGVNDNAEYDKELLEFFKYQQALTANTTNDIPTFGIIEFTIEYESDIGDGCWAGNGPDFIYGNKGTGSREFVYENGKLILNTGGTFTYNWEEINKIEEDMKNID